MASRKVWYDSKSALAFGAGLRRDLNRGGRACHSAWSIEVSCSLASDSMTSRVWSEVSVIKRDNSRVSFSGCSATAVVVVRRPVGPSRSIFRGRKPCFVFSTVMPNLVWLKGEELLRRYDRPDGWGTVFCGTCGSPVPKLHPSGGAYWVPAGLLDDDPGVGVEGHIFVGSKARWDEIAGSAPQFDEGFDGPPG